MAVVEVEGADVGEVVDVVEGVVVGGAGDRSALCDCIAVVTQCSHDTTSTSLKRVTVYAAAVSSICSLLVQSEFQ